MGHFFNPPPPFMGGCQPHAPRQLAPAITAVPVNNPPLGHAERTLDAMAVIIAVSQPPPAWPFIGGWEPFSPRQLAPSITAVQVDNPPFSQNERSQDETEVISRSWQAPWLLPQRSRYLVQGSVQVTYVPFGQGWLPGVLRAWQSPDAQPQQPGKLSPGIPGQSVDRPPPLERMVLPVPALDPPPTIPDRLPVSVIAVPADDPPFGLLDTIIEPWGEQPGLPVVPRYLVQPGIAVTYVPGRAAWLPAVLQAWMAADPRPQISGPLNPSITAVRVDNPPFGIPNIALQVALRAAQPPDPAPQQSGKLSPGIPGQSVDLPPLQRVPLSPHLWSLPDPALQVRSFVLPQVQVQVSYNPFVPSWLATVLSAWSPGDPQPQKAGLLNPFFTAVRVDNPPGIELATAGIIASWQLPPAQPWIPEYVVQPGAVAPAQTAPLAQSWLSAILLAWQPFDLAPQRRGQLSPGIPGQSVDNPPPAAGLPQAIWAAWQQPLPQPWQPRYIVQVSLPPPFARPWLAGVTRSWWAPDPLPTLSGKLAPSITAVRVDEPPYSQRNPLPGILAAWQPPPPDPTLTTSMAAIIGAIGNPVYSAAVQVKFWSATVTVDSYSATVTIHEV